MNADWERAWHARSAGSYGRASWTTLFRTEERGARDWMDHSRKDRIQRKEMTQGGRYFIYRPPPDCISSPDHTGRSGARLTRRLAGAPEAWSVHTASASMAPS